MAQGRKLPNIKASNDFDELDSKLVAHVQDNPDWTYQSAADYAGCSTSTSYDRITRLRRTTWVQNMRASYRSLGKKQVAAIERGMDDPAMAPCAQVALKLGHGLGVLEDKQQHSVRLEDATPEQLQAALDKLSDDQLRAIIAKRRACSDGSTNSGSADGQGSITS